MPAAEKTRSSRLEARVTPVQKALFERAAALEGKTLTDFMIGSLQQAARRAVEEHEAMRLSARETKAFVAALLKAPEPSPRLVEAVRRRKTRIAR